MTGDNEVADLSGVSSGARDDKLSDTVVHGVVDGFGIITNAEMYWHINIELGDNELGVGHDINISARIKGGDGGTGAVTGRNIGSDGGKN